MFYITKNYILALLIPVYFIQSSEVVYSLKLILYTDQKLRFLEERKNTVFITRSYKNIVVFVSSRLIFLTQGYISG